MIKGVARSMTQLYLIRHGEACIIKDGIVNDYGLTELGVVQARKLRDRLVRSRKSGRMFG
ncbi:histidine phosphatase family protein [Paenibacillus faecis]|uniref:Histidine phosphatase family protein n=1 Tax=Paenibacillus faecis TaxID=862114 RepID=A0A5D0CJA8_9BACL|nr:histidine phosphatase family protein [Paenibacillus faecis]